MSRADDHFSEAYLLSVFPPERTVAFFEALYGEDQEGAYDIRLTLEDEQESELRFYFALHQRPGRCLVCSVTHGLPHVFERHPVIALRSLVTELAGRAGWDLEDVWWRLGKTEEPSAALHRIGLTILRHPQKDA